MKIFRDKERETNLERQIIRLTNKLQEAERQLDKLKQENRALRDDKDMEHLENYKQHKIILEIRKIVSKPSGTIKELIDMVHKIKELINTGNID